jgi:TatD DNase family protein
MYPYINIHSHRKTDEKNEIVLHNYILDSCSPEESINANESEFFSIGIHPWYIPQHPKQALEYLNRLSTYHSCQAIGEVGLDKNAATDMSAQEDIYIQQLKIASKQHLPLIIHCVKAWNEIIAIHSAYHPEIPCIIHGFRGKPQLAESLINAGFYLSFGFHFNEESIKICPSHRLFLETDEDLRPISELYEAVSNIRQCSVNELKIQCFDNLRNLNKKLQVSLKGRTFVEL